MSDRDTFGPRLRRERERRGITLDTIATVTKVGMDLWAGLEKNDFSRWPSGIFARAFIRDYARAVGLDEDEIVDEFCRLFPQGDRRGHATMQDIAAIVATAGEFKDEFPHAERRQSVLRAQDAAEAEPGSWQSSVLDAAKSASDAVVGFARRRTGIKPT